MPSEDTHWVGVKVPSTVHTQLIAAFQTAGHPEGYGSIDDLISEAIQKEIRRLQWSYNQGRPWGDRSAGRN